jgi:hypothetical protein
LYQLELFTALLCFLVELTYLTFSRTNNISLLKGLFMHDALAPNEKGDVPLVSLCSTCQREKV